jgi:protease I
MSDRLKETCVAFLVANEGVEEVELTAPLDAVRREAGRTTIIAPEGGDVHTFDHLDRADRFPVDRTITDADVDQFDALVLPGGVANPDQLRQNPEAVAFVRAFVESGKPVAAICHAPWLLVESGAARGRTLTSFPSLRTDIENAGGTWVDEEVVEDGNIVTSRNPHDLPAFCERMVRMIAGAGVGAR